MAAGGRGWVEVRGGLGGWGGGWETTEKYGGRYPGYQRQLAC